MTPVSGYTSTNPFSYLQELGSGEVSEPSDSTGSSSVESESSDKKPIDEKDEPLSEKSHCPATTMSIFKSFIKEWPSSHGDIQECKDKTLCRSWTLWYLRPPVGCKSNQENFESLLKDIGTFSTVQEFWAIYLSLKRVTDLAEGTTDYSLFTSDIRPVWEDPSNADGGKLVLRLKKGGTISERFWELLVSDQQYP